MSKAPEAQTSIFGGASGSAFGGSAFGSYKMTAQADGNDEAQAVNGPSLDKKPEDLYPAQVNLQISNSGPQISAPP